MDNKKLVPQIRFKGFADHWEKKKFIDIFQFLKNNTYSRKSLVYHHGLVKNIHYGDILTIFNYHIDYNNSNIPYIKNNVKIVGDYLSNGDIVFTDTAEDNTVGKCIELCNVKKGIVAGLHTYPCRANIKFAKYYLGYLLNSDYFHNQLIPLIQGTKVCSLSKSAFSSTQIVYPIKSEQEKIGTYFYKLDKLIDLHKKKIKKLLNIKNALLKKMFPNDDENVPEIRFKGFTENWEKKKLGNIGSTYNGLTGKSKDDFGHGNALYIPYLNIFNNPIIDNSKLEPIEIDFRQNKVLYGDIFFTTSSETPEEVGMSSVWLYNHDNIYLNSFCFGYRLNNIHEYNLLFFTYLLRSLSVRKKISILAQGISRYNISKNKVMELEILFSKKQEQEKIGKYFYKLDKLISLYEKEIEKLTNLKKAFLKKMFV